MPYHLIQKTGVKSIELFVDLHMVQSGHRPDKMRAELHVQ